MNIPNNVPRGQYEQRQLLYNEYTRLQAQQDEASRIAQETQQEPGLLERGLSLIGAPLRGVIGTLSGIVPRPGGPTNPLEGLIAGLTEQPTVPQSFAGEIKERFGELGGMQIPGTPFYVSGSMLAGFPLDWTLDPLSYIGFGKLGLKAGEVAARAHTVAEGSNVIAKTVAGSMAPMSYESIKLPEDVILKTLTQIPVIGQVFKPIGRFTSPLFHANNPFKPFVARRYTISRQIAQMANQLTQDVSRHPSYNAFMSLIDPKTCTIGLTNGTRIAFGALEDSRNWDLVDENARPMIRLLLDAIGDTKARLDHFGIVPDPTSWDFIEGGKDFGNYIPRVRLRDWAQLPADEWRIPELRGFMKRRKYKTMAEELAKDPNARFADPVRATLYYVTQANRQILDTQFRNALVAAGLAVPAGDELKKMLAQVTAARKSWGVVSGFHQLVTQLTQGKHLPTSSIRKDVFENNIPDLVNRLDDINYLKVEDVQAVLPRLKPDIKAALEDIDWKELNAAVEILRKAHPRIDEDRLWQMALTTIGKEERAEAKWITEVHEMAHAEMLGRKKQAIADLGDNVKELLGVKDAEVAALKGQYDLTKASEKTRLAGLVKARGLGGMVSSLFFTEGNAASIEKELRRMNPGLQALTDAAGLVRTMSTTFDMGYGFLQGLPLLARNPVEWGKAQLEIFRGIASRNPAEYSARLGQEPWVREIRARYKNLAWANPEQFEAIDILSRLTVIPADASLQRRLIGEAVRPIAWGVRQSQALFDLIGNIQRAYTMRALGPTAEKLGRVDEIVDLANRMSGVTFLQELGIGPTQRAIESSFLFFAPRYLRASLMLVGDIVSGGMKAQEAQKTLAAMLVNGIMMYTKTAYAIGQEPVLDPTDSRFLTLEIEGSHVGIGSIWPSLFRLVSKAVSNPDSLLEGEETNPAVIFARSRLAPFGSAAVDTLLFHENYIGEPLETPVDLLKYIGTRLMPFALDSYIMTTPRPAISAFLAEEMGLRSFPVRYNEKRDEVAQRLSTTPLQLGGFGYSQPYTFDQLPAEEQAVVLADKEIEQLPLPPGQRGERLRQQKSIFDKAESQLTTLVSQIQAAQVPDIYKTAYYRQSRSQIMADRNLRLADLEEAVPGYRDQLARDTGQPFNTLDFETQRDIERANKLTPLPDRERARRKYLSFFQTDNTWEEPNYDEAEAYFNSLPQATKKYIEDRQLADTIRLPEDVRNLESQLIQDRRKLVEYWQLRDDVLEQRGLKEEVYAMTPLELAAFKQTTRWKKAQAQWNKARQEWRRRNPDEEALLIKWGYVSTPIRQQRA